MTRVLMLAEILEDLYRPGMTEAYAALADYSAHDLITFANAVYLARIGHREVLEVRRREGDLAELNGEIAKLCDKLGRKIGLATAIHENWPGERPRMRKILREGVLNDMLAATKRAVTTYNHSEGDLADAVVRRSRESNPKTAFVRQVDLVLQKLGLEMTPAMAKATSSAVSALYIDLEIGERPWRAQEVYQALKQGPTTTRE